MIRIENLVKSYGGHPVLQGVNLEVGEGEIYGFIGHNGAGKSTTMNILTGLIDFQSGRCTINGRDVKSQDRRMVKDIGYLPEDPRFYPYMNAWEYLSFIGTMGGDSPKKIMEKSKRLLELVKLTKAAKRPVGGYSRGMKQRLGIAVAMYHDPRILLLDEPSSALDPEGRMDVVSILSHLKSQGKTVFLSTHILNDIERVCDRVGILHDGRIMLEESLDVLMDRFIQPVYDIEFETAPEERQWEALRARDYLDRVVVDGRKAGIWLKSVGENANRLLKEVVDMEIPVISMNLRKSSLEEIFLKVVKQDE